MKKKHLGFRKYRRGMKGIPKRLGKGDSRRKAVDQTTHCQPPIHLQTYALPPTLPQGLAQHLPMP